MAKSFDSNLRGDFCVLAKSYGSMDKLDRPISSGKKIRQLRIKKSRRKKTNSVARKKREEGKNIRSTFYSALRSEIKKVFSRKHPKLKILSVLK